MQGTLSVHFGSRASSCLENGGCAGLDRSLWCSYQRWSRELLQKLTLLDVLGTRGVIEASTRNHARGAWPPRSASRLAPRGRGDLGTRHSQCHPSARARFVLKGNELSLELLVEQLQLFLFAKDVITVKSQLLPLAIWLLLLFLHLLLYLSEHLKQLVFLLLWRLDADKLL